MPFIDSKISMTVSDEKKVSIKEKLGKAISVMGKTESYLMVGFDDDYDLFFAGKKVEKGAYVAVSVYGSVRPEQADAMTEEICKILNEELDIPADKVYVTYRGVTDWGFNGRNF